MRRVALSAVLLSAVLSCDSPSQPAVKQTTQTTQAFIVSNPTASGLSGSSGTPGVSAALHAAISPVAFVSLPPGSMPGALRATILNRGGITAVEMVDGGFDPIAVNANAGDTLTVTVSIANTTRVFSLTVPSNRPPKIVRTYPPPFKRDVVLNARLVVVFSEPVEIALQSGEDIQLRKGDNVVEGSLAYGDALHTIVEFTPASAFDPGTDYELVVTQSIRDRDGSTLEAGQRVIFTTVPPPIVPPAIPFGVIFELTEYQYIGRPDEWYYSPEIMINTVSPRSTATFSRVTFKVPGFSVRPVCTSDAHVAPGADFRAIFPGIFGDFETAFTFGGAARSPGGVAEAFIEFTDYAGRSDSVTVKGPITRYETLVDFSVFTLNTRCQ